MMEEGKNDPIPFLAIAYSEESKKFLEHMEQTAIDIMTVFALPSDMIGEPTKSNVPITQEHTWPLTCYKLEELGMWHTSACCSSCHEDAEIEDGSWYPLCDHTLPDGREIRVCCCCEPWDAQTDELLELS